MCVQYPGTIYHVMSRGDQRDDIFLDDLDRQDFLKTLAEACVKAARQVHAFCLMSNHFHPVIETPNANLIDRQIAGRDYPYGRMDRPEAEHGNSGPWATCFTWETIARQSAQTHIKPCCKYDIIID
jgi:hypothetical protein